ncbi:ABC transporter substrate-binding protein [Alloscardovia macacae]|uniref:ABC transporter substrate-binding protein n=1 Tax=Alloscardovia macacae TaxID=1160091 RepID=A0A1Y2SZZ7_9BIFI|nr:ABC transporter substrate-binding protein [Alloscardovia macacae]OTA26030.1 ABC transporter substrate-binding protein [Alloscardovia macacae]OTA29889.1 ABC transporter substrate-binding protein [Alloscardovia macacae]
MKNAQKIRRALVAAAAAATVFVTSACSFGLGGESASSAASGDTVNIAAIYPETGQYAEYGKLFKRGFDLALEEVNADGGVQGKKLGIQYYDTQSDAKQDASVAPKIAADSSVVAVVGDYASSASAAASPTFNQAKLVHYGFNNSATNFTNTGEYVWSPQITQNTYQTLNAQTVAKAVGASAGATKKISVVYIENDWGKEAYKEFAAEAARVGLDIAYESSYLADSTDLSPILIKARDAQPEAVVNIGYGPDGALVLNTLRNKLSWTGPFFGGQETAEFLDNAGKNASGTIITGIFSATGVKTDEQKRFVSAFEKKYGHKPGNFEVVSYQAIKDLAYGMNKTSATREGVQKALQTVTDFPLYQGDGGTFAFDTATRRAKNIDPILLIVKDGAFVRYEE